MKLVCSGKYSRGRMLYLPKAAATVLEIGYGDTINFYMDNDELVLRKAEQAPSSEKEKK